MITGQKVKCVKVNLTSIVPSCYPGSYWCPNWPVKGEIYHIRDVVDLSGAVFVRLIEVVNPLRPFHGARDGLDEAVFLSEWFVPVRDTDISVFTDMLDKVGELV